MTLEQLVERCKGSVTLAVNGHRDCYQTVGEWMRDLVSRAPEHPFDADEEAELASASAVYELHFYPDTPVGFFRCYGSSLASVLARAARCLLPEE